MLGLTGAFGVPLYTEIVVSGGDHRGQRNHPVHEPESNYEISSFGIVGVMEATGGSILHGLTMKIGPGPEGSSPYMDSRCSMGSGIEKDFG